MSGSSSQTSARADGLDAATTVREAAQTRLRPILMMSPRVYLGHRTAGIRGRRGRGKPRLTRHGVVRRHDSRDRAHLFVVPVVCLALAHLRRGRGKRFRLRSST